MVEINNIARIMKIKKILFEKTSDQHGLTLQQIIAELRRDFGEEYTPSLETIRRSVRELDASGFRIEEKRGSRNTVSYHHMKPFETYELRILVDALSSARFITAAEAGSIIGKLETLTNEGERSKLSNRVANNGMVRATNREVRYHIDKIHQALNERRQLCFQHGHYDINQEFVLRHGGAQYKVIPRALVWRNDYYYLVADQLPDYQRKNFRVDRMKSLEISNTYHDNEYFDLEAYMQGMFNMYPGSEERVKIHFHHSLINVVIDRFGLGDHIRLVDDRWFELSFRAVVNDGFIRWLLTWGSDAEVVSPAHLMKRMKREAEKMYELYQKQSADAKGGLVE